MDVLWSPWRYDYIKKSTDNSEYGSNDCVFCVILNNSATDEENFILHRAEFNFAILNVYPYIGGHMMILPFEHVASLDLAPKEATDELMDMTKSFQKILRKVYEPHGINIGMNQGKAAGAGVAEHFHMHLLPRWTGDTNFMTAIGETRTIPETLTDTYTKIRAELG